MFDIKVADKNNLNGMSEMYDEVNDYLKANINYPGWSKGLYPNRETAEEAIDAGTLFILTNNIKIVGAVILNKNQPEEYQSVKWGCDLAADKVLVVHTLVVHPAYQKMGGGKRLLKYTEEYAEKNGCRAIRLDVAVQNTPAIQFYQRYGFYLIGTVDLHLPYEHLKWFYLYELLI